MSEELLLLKEWREKILHDIPDAYDKCPEYMANLDNDIKECEENDQL